MAKTLCIEISKYYDFTYLKAYQEQMCKEVQRKKKRPEQMSKNEELNNVNFLIYARRVDNRDQ